MRPKRLFGLLGDHAGDERAVPVAVVRVGVVVDEVVALHELEAAEVRRAAEAPAVRVGDARCRARRRSRRLPPGAPSAIRFAHASGAPMPNGPGQVPLQFLPGAGCCCPCRRRRGRTCRRRARGSRGPPSSTSRRRRSRASACWTPSPRRTRTHGRVFGARAPRRRLRSPLAATAPSREPKRTTIRSAANGVPSAAGAGARSASAAPSARQTASATAGALGRRGRAGCGGQRGGGSMCLR